MTAAEALDAMDWPTRIVMALGVAWFAGCALLAVRDIARRWRQGDPR